jgi:uncharacterized protein YgbK (DUF1537 family)
MSEDLLLTYYGDDFTGSTDVMEALSLAGVRTLLFLDPPRRADLERFGAVRALGIAGNARAMTPGEMNEELPVIFRRLRDLGGRLVHYKICSTFDSAPGIGSIGQAIDIGQQVLKSAIIPLVVGAPRLGRYCVFGNLFARSGLESPVFRLDRHPTMRMHPVTPMRESDLRLVLAEQTSREVVLVDAVSLDGPLPEVRRRLADLAAQATPGTVMLFDVLYEAHLPAIGEFIWTRATEHAPLFAVGSSGMEYALAAHWHATTHVPGVVTCAPLRPADRIVVVSGSCSPVTDAQIALALECGWAEIPVDPIELLDPSAGNGARTQAGERALAALAGGRSAIVHTCRGPRDPRLARVSRWLTQRGESPRALGRELGQALGDLLRRAVEAGVVRRAVVAGGDTSAYVVRALRIAALEMAAPLEPGCPLCRVHDPGGPCDGLELALKGGQTGHRDFFIRALSGGEHV